MPNKNFFCLMAFAVALAELGAFFVQAASQDNTTNLYQADATYEEPFTYYGTTIIY